MTTNQTIDGVPRADLQAVYDELTDWKSPVAQKLRALLDANPEENGPRPECGGGSLVTLGCSCSPSWPMHKPAARPLDSPVPFPGYPPVPDDRKLPVAQPQGEPAAWANGEQLLLCSRSPREVQPNNPMMHNLPRNIAGSALRTDYCNTPLYAEQPAPVAVELPERSSQDYAIEHAEYMAQSADDVLAKFQAYGLALLAIDEGGDDGEGELFEAIDTARGDLQESLVDLRGMVYEFRKRSSRCTSL